jgi:phenylalanyl-tRNA synthetase beta chain
MKISYHWLQEYVDCGQVPVEEIAHMLTMVGLEVEGEETFSFRVPETVVVGKILRCERHADASNLFICQVDVGSSAPVTIVCGAPNTQAGLTVPVALSDTTLPNGMLVKTATIRGVVSQGMICAEDELGISEDHTGIIVLPEDAPIGQPVTRDMFGFVDDTVLEIGLTPNRGDCLSHFGVARELATLLDLPLRKPSIDYAEEGGEVAEIASVAIDDPDLCYRYTASVISDVTIGPSPAWLRQRLERIGVRSINNVVDVTNYVMMELGQPLHAFDLEMLEEQRIVVRRAQPDERFTTLDDTERQLDDAVLMIADGKRSVAIGGVMGGQNSEVSDTTTQILLESAYFAPPGIRSTSKKLGLMTEASYRFERYIDLLSVDVALKRATKLIAELAGGKVAKGIIDVFPHTDTSTTIPFRPERVRQILGVDVAPEKSCEILSRLGFTVTAQTQTDSSQQHFQVEAPSYRPDVTREIDLIEEIGRIYGYDNIPTRLPSGEIPPSIEQPSRVIETKIRDLLVSQGMHEIVTYSFFDQQSLENLLVSEMPPYNRAVPLQNPLNVEQDILRTTLLPGLLKTVALNANRMESLRFFEVGRVFFQTSASVPDEASSGTEASLPDEAVRISGVLSGFRTKAGWNQTPVPVDFYDLKGMLENILSALGVAYEFRSTKTFPFLHPGESAAIYAADQEIGLLGKLHPDVIENFHLDKDHVYIFELLLEYLVEYSSFHKHFCSLPKFPAVHRGIAVVVPPSVCASEVETTILEAGKPLLEDVMLFDRYVGPQISEGAVGLTYSLTYRSLEKTLSDDEVTQIHLQIIDHLNTQLGVVLRQ